ncbi:hypothetical protein BGZ58_006607, partial [Dissophora ornata]
MAQNVPSNYPRHPYPADVLMTNYHPGVVLEAAISSTRIQSIVALNEGQQPTTVVSFTAENCLEHFPPLRVGTASTHLTPQQPSNMSSVCDDVVLEPTDNSLVVYSPDMDGRARPLTQPCYELHTSELEVIISYPENQVTSIKDAADVHAQNMKAEMDKNK